MTRLVLLPLAAIGALSVVFAGFCALLGWLEAHDAGPDEMAQVQRDVYTLTTPAHYTAIHAVH